MHGIRHKSPSQLCCGFGIQLRVIGWPVFGRITGSLRFTCLRGLCVSYGFILLCYFMEQRLLNYYMQKDKGVLLRIILAVES